MSFNPPNNLLLSSPFSDEKVDLSHLPKVIQFLNFESDEQFNLKVTIICSAQGFEIHRQIIFE